MGGWWCLSAWGSRRVTWSNLQRKQPVTSWLVYQISLLQQKHQLGRDAGKLIYLNFVLFTLVYSSNFLGTFSLLVGYKLISPANRLWFISDAITSSYPVCICCSKNYIVTHPQLTRTSRDVGTLWHEEKIALSCVLYKRAFVSWFIAFDAFVCLFIVLLLRKKVRCWKWVKEHRNLKSSCQSQKKPQLLLTRWGHGPINYASWWPTLYAWFFLFIFPVWWNFCW